MWGRLDVGRASASLERLCAPADVGGNPGGGMPIGWPSEHGKRNFRTRRGTGLRTRVASMTRLLPKPLRPLNYPLVRGSVPSGKGGGL